MKGLLSRKHVLGDLEVLLVQLEDGATHAIGVRLTRGLQRRGDGRRPTEDAADALLLCVGLLDGLELGVPVRPPRLRRRRHM